LTDTYSYDVFGALRSHTGSSTNYWQFTGQQSDSTSNLYYLRARYYDPASGRFLTQDPLRGSGLSPQSLNPYAYALNNPTNRVDPSGLDSEGKRFDCGLALAGVILFLIGLVLAPEAAPFELQLAIQIAEGATLGLGLAHDISHGDVVGSEIGGGEAGGQVGKTVTGSSAQAAS
jgi:RHS repeat-associated protein